MGIDDLERIPEFLDLGLIVVVSPDPTTLRRWQHEQELGEAPMDRPAATTGVVVEMDARRISTNIPIDIYSIRSLIQRLRAKLRAVAAPDTIAPVRSFGFRLEQGADDTAAGTGRPSSGTSLAR
ncbi:MAG: helix-turn-helix domain-containing protein [Actinobacteria bacterium]|nr:MAG: helix-turn-helix domain-containing protein [Actinomycetota bacterium]